MSEDEELPGRPGRLLGLLLLEGHVGPEDLKRLFRHLDRRSGGVGLPEPDLLEELVRRGLVDARTLEDVERRLRRKETRPGSATPDAGAAAPGPGADPGAEGGTHFGRFVLGGLLGAGGMGEVYRAWDPSLGRHVALKLLRHVQPENVERFLGEARAQARVEHEGICRVWEVGEVKGIPYLALQLVAGPTLGEAASGLPLEQRARLLRDVAEAVHAAHRTGLIHRDIKPGNVLVERREDGSLRPFVTDFGLAREMEAPGLTRTGMTLGTPHYMAPEQVVGDPSKLDRRTDVWALGATLYELVSGRPPFDGQTGVEIMMRLLEREPVPLSQRNPQVPRDLSTIVGRCLEKEPARRYDSARALAEDLDRFLSGDPVSARPVSRLERLVRRARKHRAVAAALALAGVVSLAFLGLYLRSQWTAQQVARLSRRLGQQVARIEEVARLSRTVPLHDTRPAKEQVRGKMAEISAEMRAVGRTGKGPGLYALGRAHLTLLELEKARELLEEAWRAGFREPEAAYALGLALGRLYQRELERLAGIGARDVREARRKALQESLLKPAAAYLALGHGAVVDAPEYAQGLLALYQGQPREAIEKARAVITRSPWLYEARILEAEAHLLVANQKRDAGEEEAALVEYEAGDAAYRQALEVGRSDAAGWEGLAGLWAHALQMQAYGRGGDTARSVSLVEQAAANALVADPERGVAEEKLSWAYRAAADVEERRGGDPVPLLEKAVRAAQGSLAKDGTNAHAWRQLGTAQQLLGDWTGKKRQDPRPLLLESARSYRRAIELSPSDAAAQNGLGNTLSIRAQWEARHGVDPRPSWAEAIASFERAVAIDPRFAYPFSNLGVTYQDQAQWEEGRGLYEEAFATLEKAAETIRKAISINPKYLFGQNNLASGLERQARLALRIGRDPEPLVAAALRHAGIAIDLNPKYARAYLNRGAAYEGRCAADVMAGRDPSASVAPADEALRKAAELMNGRFDRAHRDRAMVHLHAARHAREAGSDPRPHLARSREAAEASLAATPDFSDGLEALADVAVEEARLELAARRSPEAALRRALELVERARGRDRERDRARLLATGARAHLVEAVWRLSRKASASESLAAGRELARAALGIDPRSAEAKGVDAALRLSGATSAAQADAAAGDVAAAIREFPYVRLLLDPDLVAGRRPGPRP